MTPPTLRRHGLAPTSDHLARSLSSTSPRHPAQTCVGTPYYLSPEVIEGRPYNHLSDVWALGVVLFQMISFRYPFEAPTLPALALRIVRRRPAPWSAPRTRVTPAAPHACPAWRRSGFVRCRGTTRHCRLAHDTVEACLYTGLRGLGRQRL